MNNIIIKFEKIHKIIVPEIFKVHLLLNSSNQYFQFFKTSDFPDFEFPLTYLSFSDNEENEYMLDSVVTTQNFESKIEHFKAMWGNKILNQFYPISFDVYPKHQWLLLGVSPKNYGEIWLSSEGGGNDCVKVFDTLYNFYESCEIMYRESLLRENRSLNDLYRNWGEDFWRVREENK